MAVERLSTCTDTDIDGLIPNAFALRWRFFFSLRPSDWWKTKNQKKKSLKQRAKSINTRPKEPMGMWLFCCAQNNALGMAMNRRILELFVAFACAPAFPCARHMHGDDLSEFVWQTDGASKKFKLFANYFARAVIVFGDKFSMAQEGIHPFIRRMCD